MFRIEFLTVHVTILIPSWWRRGGGGVSHLHPDRGGQHLALLRPDLPPVREEGEGGDREQAVGGGRLDVLK